MLPNFVRIALFAAVPVLIVACSKKEEPALATVGEARITVDSFRSSLEALPPQWQARAKTPSGRKQILEHQIRAQLIELEAEDRGISSEPKVAYQIEQAVQRILLQELMKVWQNEFDIPEEDLLDYYNKNKQKFAGGQKYRAQHVLVKVSENASQAKKQEARQKALAAKKKIEDGAKFEDVAREMSEGPSASKGGDLGYVEKGRFHPKFEETALSLKPGELSGPVQTPFGFHIIRLVDVKEPNDQSFEDVKDEIRKQIMPRKRQEAFEAFMTSLKQKYEVKIDDEALQKLEPEPGKEKKKNPKDVKEKKDEGADADTPAPE